MRRFLSAIAFGSVLTAVLSGCGGGSNNGMPETDPNALISLVDFYFSKQEKIGAP